jgi:hypothetical protein
MLPSVRGWAVHLRKKWLPDKFFGFIERQGGEHEIFCNGSLFEQTDRSGKLCVVRISATVGATTNGRRWVVARGFGSFVLIRLLIGTCAEVRY